MTVIERICVQQHLPHELHIVNHLKENHENLYAAFMKNKLWDPSDTITVCFVADNEPPRTPITKLKQIALESNEEIDPLQYEVEKLSVKDAIKKIVNERIQPLIPMKIKWVNDPKDAYVTIGFDTTGGSYSLVGTDSKYSNDGKATMNFGWFDVQTVIHEWGHVLGMIHEHQNPKGGIKWNVPKVLEWAKKTQGWDRDLTERNILQHYDKNHINGSEFDPKSIMLYFFPADLTLDKKGTNPNLKLSKEDIEWITKIYGTDNKNINIIQNSSSSSWKIILLITMIVIIVAVFIFFYYFKLK